MNDNLLYQRTQAQLQSLVDIITEHCNILTLNRHLSQEYVDNFEQHIEHTVTNFATYTILQRATLTLHVDLPELAIAHPITVLPSELYTTSSSTLPPSPFTNRQAHKDVPAASSIPGSSAAHKSQDFQTANIKASTTLSQHKLTYNSHEHLHCTIA